MSRALHPLAALATVALAAGTVLGCGDGDDAAGRSDTETGGEGTSADAPPSTAPSSTGAPSSTLRPVPTVPAPPPPDVTFTPEIRRDGAALVVSFSLRNDGDEPQLAVDGADEADETPTADETPLYAVDGDEEGTAELSSRTFAMTVTGEIAAPFTIPVTRVAPGDEITGEYRVPLPVVGRSPYERVSDVDLSGEIARVVFCLGVVPEAEVEGLGESSEGHPRIEHVFQPAASVLCSDAFDLG